MCSYYFRIRAYDTENVQKGALFEIPVTVVQPHVLESDHNTPVFEPASSKGDKSVEFQPNTIQRDFILVPEHATWAGKCAPLKDVYKITNSVPSLRAAHAHH